MQIEQNTLDYLKRFGRKDQGPSEVSHSYGCFIDKHSNIYVIDHGNMRVQIFSPDGEPKGSIRMQHQSFSGVVLSPEIIVLTAISFHTGNLGFIDSENPSMLAIADLHAYKVMVHQSNVNTAMDSCTKADPLC